jgi:hypothetical protein
VAHSLQNGIVKLNWSWDQECWVGWLVRHNVRGRLRCQAGRLRCPAGRRATYIVVGHCRALCGEGRVQLKDGFSVEMSSKETEPGGSAWRSQGGYGGVKSDRCRSGDTRVENSGLWCGRERMRLDGTCLWAIRVSMGGWASNTRNVAYGV